MTLSLTEFVSRNAQWYPDKIAVICEGRRRTWGEFNGRANRVANNLKRRGIKKGDRVAIVSPNCLEYPEIMFGVLKAGAIIVPISTMLRVETVSGELQDAEVRAVFSAHSGLPLVSEYRQDCHRILLSGREDGWVHYEDFLQDGSDAAPDTVLLPEDLYNVIYSSGTTGTPKGIVHTHQARALFAMTCGLEFRVHNEAVSLISTPVYTNGTQLTYLPTLLVGGTVVLMPSFDPSVFLKLVQSEKCTHAFLVPTQFIRLMDAPGFGEFDTSSLEILISAAAPLLRETKTEILKKFPRSKLVELYGITEGISTVLRPDEQLSKLGSVGKPRLGGDIKIIDDQGNELAAGETGEIVGFNLSMMAGYFRAHQKTLDALWHDSQGRTYIRTGDIGRLDKDGYLYVLDRKKDLIISGGMNIFPSDIEAVLLSHPQVKEAAVIGIPHREWGETPAAIVVNNDVESLLPEEDLKLWTNQRLAGYQKLAAVKFQASLPRNDLGKVLKHELRLRHGIEA